MSKRLGGYGTFFSQNFESEFSKNSDPPAEPKLESEFGQIPTRALGLTTWSEVRGTAEKEKEKSTDFVVYGQYCTKL